MGTKNPAELADRLRVDGFIVKPMPLGGYMIANLRGTPLLATAHRCVPIHHLAPGNHVDIRPATPHLYTVEV